MDLKQVGSRTYYIDNPTNIGIFKIDDEKVYLIDSGNDKDAGRKIMKIIEANGFKVEGILATHSNADHVGGNKYIQDKTGCCIFSSNIEQCFLENPILEASFLYGGYPFKDLRNKFLMAKESSSLKLTDLDVQGIEYFPLKGHFFDMVGYKTVDDVFFLGDSLFSEDIISKYHIFFIYDVKAFLETLDYLDSLDGKLFIPSHARAVDDISKLTDLNRKKVKEIADKIIEICRTPSTYEKILKIMFDHYNLEMNANQYVLIGSTVRSYISYLYEENKLYYEIKDNEMYWKIAN